MHAAMQPARPQTMPGLGMVRQAGGDSGYCAVALGERDHLEPLGGFSFEGMDLRLSRKRVSDRVVYRHQVPGHLLHVMLSGTLRRFTGQFGGRPANCTSGRKGMVSFTPPAWERLGALEGGMVVAAEIELAPWFVEECCEARIRHETMDGFFNGRNAKIFALVNALAGSAREDVADALAIDTLALALARHVGHRMGGAARRRDDGWLPPAALRRVVERIEGDMARPPRMEELARLAGLGPSAFIRAFRGSIGRTPAAFALDRRLARAREALLRNSASLEAIATDHGFSSKAHFITAFRARYGCTPGGLRPA